MTISVIIALSVVCGACIKFGLMKVWHVLIAGALGFYLADSSIGPVIGGWLGNFFEWVGTLKV